ncbi:hypothetical protein NC651_030684 [Populus alba x Populus x berolinensis]|nr:hypothetical protein NC651_030684 [Populus alba x Populus x berolinensis]
MQLITDNIKGLRKLCLVDEKIKRKGRKIVSSHFFFVTSTCTVPLTQLDSHDLSFHPCDRAYYVESLGCVSVKRESY